ncbi:MAG: gliding motility-associated C-terminal domain-containing protein [Bacteroidota bacterium]
MIYVAVPWVQPTAGTSDYFNSCAGGTQFSIPKNSFGYQFSHSGNGYAGFFAWGKTLFSPPNAREYVQCPLIDSLEENKSYFVEFFVSLSNTPLFSPSNAAVNTVGAYLSDSAVFSINTSGFFDVVYIPQVQSQFNIFLSDTMNWMKIGGIYKAHGGEHFITIGNFNDDQHTDTLNVVNGITPSAAASYYYIDDVSIYKITEPKASSDTSICLGDSLIIGANDTAIACTWFPARDLNDSTLTNPIAKPTQSRWYYVSHQNSFGYLAKDSVFITVMDCRFESELEFPNIFTPNNDGVNDAFVASAKNIDTYNCKIFNRYGLKVAELKEINEAWDGHSESGVALSDGVYYYFATAVGKDEMEYKLKGFVTLLR